MKFLKKLFGRKEVTPKPKQTIDPYNRNYVCLASDPVNTINDLRVGEWNMDKVQEGFRMGYIRYARQREVDQAISSGLIKE